MPETWPRPYTQHEREQLVASWLDITAGTFHEKLQPMTDTEIETWDQRTIGGYLRQLLTDEPDPQIMFQQLALTGDGDLHEAVAAFGTDPLTT